MDAVANTWGLSCAIVVVLCAWKLVHILWLRPKKLEKLLKNQGIKGNEYKFWYGDTKEMGMIQKSRSKHVSIDDGDEVLSHILGFTNNHAKKYGRSFVTWLGWNPRVTILEPEIIKDVSTMLNEFPKAKGNPFLRLLTTGLASYEGDQWVKHRKIINPAFNMEKLKNMVPAFQLSCSEMLKKWEKILSSDGSCELDVWPHLQALTADAISRTAFGSSYEDGVRIFKLIREQTILTMLSMQSFYIPGSRFLPTKRNMRMKAINREVKHVIGSIIDNRIKEMKVGAGNYEDLLGILIKSNINEVEKHQNKSHGMTINEVIEECKLFYLGGQETTTSLLAWTLILLSRHQEWQSRAREEVINVLGDKNIDLDGLSRLKVMNMIFYEVLRLYPPVAALQQRKVNKDTTLRGLTLPSGIQVGLPIMLMHYDELLWGSDAKKFNPERFSEGISKATKNRVIYFPFGWGPRICIGQNFAMLESKVSLAMILQRFSFEFSPSYVHSPGIVLTLQPMYGAHLTLHKL